jgi:heat shock protein HtpX
MKDMPPDMYGAMAKNKRNSILLFIFFGIFIGVLGFIIGEASGTGYWGLVIALMIAALMSIGAYYKGDKVVLAVSRAKKIRKQDAPQLFNVVEELTIASGLPMPNLYIIRDDDAPNAFATGRNPEHSSVAVTTALLSRLNRSELQGVIAHELSHVQNFDIRFATMIGVMVGTVALLCDFFLRYTFWGGGRSRSRSRSSSSGGGGAEMIIFLLAIILAILAPIFAKIIQMSVSRQREYLADASAARMTRYPEGLANALQKISRDPGILEVSNRATQHLYIVSPIKSLRDKKKSNLFSTHPPIEDRIRRLRSMK